LVVGDEAHEENGQADYDIVGSQAGVLVERDEERPRREPHAQEASQAAGLPPPGTAANYLFLIHTRRSETILQVRYSLAKPLDELLGLIE
jgi:hypothetical protein